MGPNEGAWPKTLVLAAYTLFHSVANCLLYRFLYRYDTMVNTLKVTYFEANMPKKSSTAQQYIRKKYFEGVFIVGEVKKWVKT